MANDTRDFGERRVSVQSEHVTFPQLELIIKHFGRHASGVVGVSVDYDAHTEHLDISGIPLPDSSDERARSALEDAIAAARYIHPSDDMDISA
jgi:hypothetical protein